MTIPVELRDEVCQWLWKRADELDWSLLADADRARHYKLWTKDPEIGGRLAHYMDARAVRVYIKDSLFKPYERLRLSALEDSVWRELGIDKPAEGCRRFIKPHGRAMADGTVACWGNSRDWKSILMAAYERDARMGGAGVLGVVLFENGKTREVNERTIVRNAANLLRIPLLLWIG